MPTYVYELLDPKGQPTGETFEFVQSMKDTSSCARTNRLQAG